MDHSARYHSHARPRPRPRTPSPTKASGSRTSSASSSPSKLSIRKSGSPRRTNRPTSRGALSSSSSSSGHVLQALDANANALRADSGSSPKRKGKDEAEKLYTCSTQVALPTLSPRRSDTEHVKVYVDRADKSGNHDSFIDISDDDEKENIPPESTEQQLISRSPSPVLKSKTMARRVFADIPISDPRRRFELHNRQSLTLNNDILSDIVECDSEILDDDDEVPVYATPARPRIRTFQVGDYLGPMLTSREKTGWPMSAPPKARGNFDIAKLDDVLGDAKRKIQFDIFIDSDGNKENVDPMDVAA
ncbi:hypothetical protein POJ06DRAFT_290546 [Lipomyces tetrasporus]|uniref:Uncharacterized protein n=1 Tax=Lipomyces tetrasporus TaxID=54092 RepID=A0AAD7QSQ0_9ASCO|nr:uncharacterized protein POJ06DRAFT_290546 [Lipomyces tetrasporus]KAJ8100635.1 hypothetical protein POJ06DRAFT_290546 [Lipomyces tetrasporus]